MTDERFHLLVEKHLEGALDAEEARELATALEKSEELRRRMLDEATFSGLLSRKHAPDPVDLVPKVQAALQGGADGAAMVEKVMKGLPDRSPSRFARAGWLGAAAAAAVLVVVVFLLSPSAPAVPSVAVIESVTGGVSGDGDRVLEAGDSIARGETVRAAEAVIVAPDTSHYTIRAAAVTFSDEDSMRLETGSLEAHVVTHKRVESPHSVTRGFGTEFSIVVEPRATRLTVGRGAVTFVREKDSTEIRLTDGQYSVAASVDMGLLQARPVVDPGQIDAAVGKAVRYLKSAEPPPATHHGPMNSHALVILSLIHAGVDRDDPVIQKHVETMLGEPLRRTYVVAVQAMALRALDPAKYRDRLTQCAQFLVDSQCDTGQWDYGQTTPLPGTGPVVRRRTGNSDQANNSCSAIAILGVRACVDAGIRVPEDVFARAAKWWAECPRADKDEVFGKGRTGWCYTREEKPHHPYGSMTAGGLAASILADAYQNKDWRKSPSIEAAVDWLGFHFSAHENFGPVEALMDRQFVSDTPQPRTEYFYYLWALERAGTLYGSELFGAHDWYAEGVEAVLSEQRSDGSWHSGVSRCEPVWDTCYAILFLKRATRPLVKR